jgi:hypothetical protein
MRTAPRLVAVFSIVVGVLATTLAAYALFIKVEAEALPKDLTKLNVGRSTGAEVQLFAQSHRRLLVSKGCDGDVCTATFKVRNTWLAALRLEPPAEFNVDVTVNDGRWLVAGKSLRTCHKPPGWWTICGTLREHYRFPTPVGKPTY